MTQVENIPFSIRVLVKLIIQEIHFRKINLTREEVTKIINELVIVKWLSKNFMIPEFYGVLPKPENFTESHKQIFFGCAHEVFNAIFTMKKLDSN